MGTRERPSDRGVRNGRRVLAIVADELRAARTAHGLSQRDVAHAAGVSHARIGRIERGELRDVPLVLASQRFRLQAVDRRVGLKARDGEVMRVVLLVADTAHDRRVLRAAREALRASFPLDGREVLAALRAGSLPAASGIVIL